jgi:valyl-tRNA synthetase
VVDGSDIESKQAAQNVLYICLDQALKLLHPFMPFVTEELYQRLPRRPNDSTPTIMMTSFPEAVSAWDNSKAGSDFEFINGVVAAARSLAAEYNLKDFTIYVQNPKETELLKHQVDTMKSLIRNCAVLEILEPSTAAPEGCTLNTFKETKIYLLVKGKVDLEKEVAKLQKKYDKLNALAAEIKKRQSAESYALNVKEEVKQADSTKLSGLEAELSALSSTMELFSRMMIE